MDTNLNALFVIGGGSFARVIHRIKKFSMMALCQDQCSQCPMIDSSRIYYFVVINTDECLEILLRSKLALFSLYECTGLYQPSGIEACVGEK